MANGDWGPKDAVADTGVRGRGCRLVTRERMSMHRPLIRLDAGWLFLMAGLCTLAATVLIPAQHDLDLARWQRDRAAAIERHRLDRIERYGTYLQAVQNDDECVVLTLAAVQLNRSPVDRVPLSVRAEPGNTSASVFADLEPPPAVMPPKPVVGERSSMLARWTINDRTRLWLLAGGVLCVLIGLLPATTPASRGPEGSPDPA